MFILALDTPFTQEMLDQGKNGLLYQKRGTQLTALIQAVETDRYQEEIKLFKVRARPHVMNNYDWNTIADGYHQLFKALI